MKFILKNYHKFVELRYKGNATAIVILIDINLALEGLTTRQKHCIRKYYFEGYLLYEIAEELDVKKQTVQEHIDKRMKNISKFLGVDSCE